MAKVKIQGNASGTGVLTVTAPNTSTDRTVTLPDATGTLTFTPSITDNGNATAITIDSSERVMIYPVTSATSAGYLQTGSRSSYYGWVDRAQNATGSNAAFFNQSGSIVGSIASTDTETKFVGVNTAKAWVNFNGTGTVAIRDSHNVSSITDNGTGDYSVNFSSSLGNDTYTVVGTCAPQSASNTVILESQKNGESRATCYTSSAHRCGVRLTSNGAFQDTDTVNIMYFGD